MVTYTVGVKYQTRYCIYCPHVYHVISQSKKFEEPSHYDISIVGGTHIIKYHVYQQIIKNLMH